MTPVVLAAPTALTAARVLAGATVVWNVAQAARRRPGVTAVGADQPVPPADVVVPARDEATRLGPLLAAVVSAPGVARVLVVDDESGDATAAVAKAAGADVVAGQPLPARWVGKAWALDQGLRAAESEWVVMLDADARPSPELPRALVARAVADHRDLLCAAGRFECPTAPLRWLHPALLTTLVYRFGPPGAVRTGPPHRRIANGQCMVVHRPTLLAAGGFAAVAHHTVEDVALVRTMATAGFSVDFVDAAGLLTVRMYESAREAFGGWGRSLTMPGVEPSARRVAGVITVALAQALPLLRLAARRADTVDVALGLVRAGTLVGTAAAYRRRGAAYWLSPSADVVAVAALARSLVGRQRWRGRRY